MLRNRQAIGSHSIYSRMVRLVIPIVMGTSLVLGLIALIGIRAVSQDSLTQTHHEQIADLLNDVEAAIQSRVSDLDALAQGRDARNFARDTLISSGNANSESAQTRLLGDFTSLLEQNPSYLALRYVTFNGSVWSEVTNYDGTIPRPDASIRLGVLADDPALTQALEIPLGQVVMSDVTYQLDPNAPILVPNVLYVRLSAPVSPDNSFNSSVAGVIQLDVRAAPLLEAVQQAAQRVATLQDGRRVILSNSQGQILYDTANPDIDYSRAFARRQSPLLAEQYPDAAALLESDAPSSDAQIAGGNVFSTERIALPGGGGAGFWMVTLVDNMALLENASNLLSLAALIGSLLVGAFISFLISVVIQRTLRPINNVTRWAAEGAAVVAPLDATASDEVTQITQAFQAISGRIETLQNELASQQGRFSRNIDLAAHISRETATLYDIDQLLNRAIDLICTEYGFYHAQVFLTDDVGENAVLVYSRGELGQQLLQNGLKIPVGSRSMIGTVAASGEALVANDTAHPGDLPYQEHPLVPLTRAEMTLPLVYGSHVIGVLDVQSSEPNSFQPDDLRTFQILADQIAVAIQNVRLIMQSEQRITQIDALNRQLTRSAWIETSERSGLAAVYSYDLLKLEQTAPPQAPALSLPIAIRGEVVGSIDATPPEGQFFTEGDNVILRAVADRVAIALENARLFEEAQIQAQRALALAEAGQLSSRMSRDFARSLEEVFTRVAKAASYDRWSLALINEAETEFEMVIEQVPAELERLREKAALLQITSDYSPVVQSYRTARTLLINYPQDYPGPDGIVYQQPELFGKMVLTPVRLGEVVIGVLMVGRSSHAADLNESDEQLATTLAAQVAIAVENQRLFQAAEGERERLSSILESLPAGVLVLDPITYRPIQYNNQIEYLLGRRILPDQPFDVETYHIYRSGTNALYPPDSLPIFTVTRTKELVASDDIAVIQADGSEIDLLMNAVPILNEDGSISAIVTALQDISALRNLERTLETNLRETVALYETTRGLAEAEEVEEVLDQVMMQLATLDASEAYVLLLDEATNHVQIARSLSGESGNWKLPDELLNPRTMLFIADAQNAAELDGATRAALQDAKIAALASIPLRARSRRDVPIGWLVISFDSTQEFSPEREQFLSTLNDSAAVALDNRYLLRSTEQALQETAALYGATTNLSRARTDDEIAAALQSAVTTLAPERIAAYFTTEDRLTELLNVSRDGEAIDFGQLITEYNLLEGANAFVEDLLDLPSPRPFERDLLARKVRAYALVHLISLNMRIGCFIVAFDSPHAFSSGDIRYLNSVADSASVVVDNYLLLDQIQSSLEETSILYQASRALSDASTPDEILNVVVGHLLNRPVTQVFLALLSTENWDNPRATAQVVATWQSEDAPGIDLTGINLVADQYPAWRLLASPNVLTIDDVANSDELDVMERIGVESLEVASLSVLPLRIAGRAIGAIVIGGREAYRHTERDGRIYRSLAEQASLRMEATRLLTQTERRARQLQTSADVSQIASSILDLNLLLPRIVDLIRDAFNYDHVQIFLMDETDTYAELRASTGQAGRQLLEIRHKLQKGSSSVIGRVTELGEATIASDTADAHVVHRPNPYLPNTRSEMAIPLKLKGQVVGALDVQSNQPNAFDDDDVQVTTALAAQISVAIDNAQLFEQARSRASEMSFLFDVTTAAASAETLQGAIQNVANELQRSLTALSVSFYLPQRYIDKDENEFTLLEPVALAGTDQPLSELSEVRLDSEDNLIAETGRTRRPAIIDNISVRMDYLPVVGGARSAILVPLASGTQLVGLVALESAALSAYGQDTLTLLLTLSGTLSAIIQNQQLLEQVQQTNEQLRELDRLKSDFLANMSHELRTPLNSIIGFSRVILKGIDGPLTEMQEQDLSTIYNSGLHLLNLINDILDQAKIAAGKMDLQFDYFEMKAVVDGVRSIGIGLVKDKPIDIFVEVAPGLPKVYGDEFRTRQILINLISNAAKFTRQGSITLSSYPVMDEESGLKMIRTDVTDTGIGVAEKDLPLLFEAFRQVDSSLTRTQGGTGLGLPISKSLVEMQGGRMLVSSRVNLGSTFSILMPTEPGAEQEEKKKKSTDHLGQPQPSAPPKPAVTGILSLPNNGNSPYATMEAAPAPYQHTKRQILLIEDNPDMVDQFRRALQREGFDIFTASIPLEAEAMASGLHPTIIIMDVNFSNGQGWGILGKIKARDDTFDIPVVVVTLSNERDRAADMGAYRFIQRPFTPDELLEAVQDAEAESRIERILIIDDDPESVRLLAQLLDEQGHYRVFSAGSGSEGIAMVARRRPNLVILDLRMPGKDGFQVVEELRNNPETATIPILVVTGDTLTTSERERLMNLAVLHKGNISADEYRQFMDGVRGYLNGDS